MKKIITISREFGSGGRFIGEEVAKKLGIKYYDKEIIGQIAKESGLAPEYIKENAELSPKKGIFAYAFTGRDITGKSVEDMVYEAQRKVILELAGKEPCVIVGRNADYILKDSPDVMNVFIYAPKQDEISAVMKKSGLNQHKAEEEWENVEKSQHARHEYITGKKRGDRHTRDILLNSSLLGWNATAQVIEELVERKFGLKDESIIKRSID